MKCFKQNSPQTAFNENAFKAVYSSLQSARARFIVLTKEISHNIQSYFCRSITVSNIKYISY